jgi:tetratricopeptide (TPR) repeat protein
VEYYFKKATELNPNLKMVHTELAKLYKDTGDYEHAVIRYRLALENDQSDVDTWLKLGNLYLKMKEPFKAQNTFLKAVELNPNSAEAHQQLGLFYNGEGRYDEAMNEFSEVIRIQPISEMAHYKIGTIKLQTGDKKKEEGDLTGAGSYYAQAQEELKQALNINPAFVDASYNLGLAYLRLGEKENAKKQWEHTLILAPNHPPTLYNLGHLYSLLKDKKRSLEKLCNFVSLQLKEYGGEIEAARKIIAAEGGCP